MRAWLSLSRDALLALTPAEIEARLAAAQARRMASTELPQLDSWLDIAVLLQSALAMPEAADWRVVLEYDLLRLDKRIDAVIVTPRAIFVLEFKRGARGFPLADRRQADDYAQDLWDFHAASRSHPLVPILVATHAPDMAWVPPLFWQGQVPLLLSNAAGLGVLLARAHAAIGPPETPLDVAAWEHAAYRPVPSIIAAAEMLYARNGVAEIAAARADTHNLHSTTAAIRAIIAQTRAEGGRSVVFVTGIPGAGKTLCGLNIAFGGEEQAAFLSGNVPLVRVLREALARNASAQGNTRLEAERHKTHAKLQNVHRFLEAGVTGAHAQPENIIVFDEAQRAWDEAQATKDTQRRKSHLSMSEPAHALDIMTRAPGFAVIVALVGQGQEINTGEAGLAEWGRAIAARPGWRAFAASAVLRAPHPEQRLPEAPWLSLDDTLDLHVPIRAIRSNAGAAWVEAVLAGDASAAAALATPDLPYFLTRSLYGLRSGLRRFCRGQRRAGLVASAGARRLRAEGLGVQVPGIEDWFLNTWPDVRSSEALETFATEYDCQGLELDAVGLAWGGDMIREGRDWLAQEFSGKRWNKVGKAENRGFIRNTYRVLLTRARYETVIWVPPGSPIGDSFHDTTRAAVQMDAIAEYLAACGARPLPEFTPPLQTEPALLL